LREQLMDAMWDDVGVLRDATGLQRGLQKLDAIEGELLGIGVPDGDRSFNLTWHDWLNLRSLVEISRVITIGGRNARTAAAPTIARTSRRRRPRHLDLHGGPAARRPPHHRRRAVQFTIVKPGESLLKEAAE
jgi:fumarate reductase flavoprotein subunit